MTKNCMDQINIYFHMKNHYRKLENVKSTINTLSPKGLQKSCAKTNSNHSLKTLNYRERCDIMCSHRPHQYAGRHGNLKSSTEPNLKSRKTSLGRRSSQRYSTDTLSEKQDKENGNENKKLSTEELNNNICSNEKTKIEHIAPNKQTKELIDKEICNGLNKEKVVIDDVTESKIAENEYIQFLLRIIEDILLNNYINSKDIFQVFERHIEANKGRLNRDKMYAHIEQLAMELQMSDKLHDTSDKSTNLKMKKYNTQTKTISQTFLTNFDNHLQGDCECSVQRVLKIGNDVCEEINICENNVVETAERNSLIKLTEGREPTNVQETSETIIANYEKVLPLCEDICFSDKHCMDSKIPSSTVSEKDIPVQNKPAVLAEDLLVARKIGNNQENVLTEENSNTNVENKTYYINNETQENKSNIQNNKICKDDQDIEGAILSRKSYIDSIQKDVQTFCTKNTVDSSTQTEVYCTDKECNTRTENIGDLTIQDYIPISCPIYVPRNVLNINGQIKLLNSVHLGVDNVSAKENLQETDNNNLADTNTQNLRIRASAQENSTPKDKSDSTNTDTSVEDNSKSCNNQPHFKHNLSISNYSLTSEADIYQFYVNKQNLCRLVDSDYDLTPERDNNFDKYHHLLNESSTIIPKSKLNELEKNPNLLITEHYAIGHSRNCKNDHFLTAPPPSRIDNRAFLNKDIKKKLVTRIKPSISLESYELESKSEGEVQKILR